MPHATPWAGGRYRAANGCHACFTTCVPRPSMQPEQALALAIAAVEETGQRLLAWRAEGRFNAEQVGHTIKAEVDRLAHDCLAQVLGVSGYPVLSEEEPEAFAVAR